MEFIGYEEAIDALRELEVEVVVVEDHLSLIAQSESREVKRLHLADEASESTPMPDAEVVAVPKDQLSAKIDAVLGQLHLTQVILLPVGKWRGVFDAVAFSLAENEDWQELDAVATVELNTRDPLLCGPADYQTLQALIDAIFADAEMPVQGLFIASTATLFIAEVIPDGAVRVTLGSGAVADEVHETVRA